MVTPFLLLLINVLEMESLSYYCGCGTIAIANEKKNKKPTRSHHRRFELKGINLRYQMCIRFFKFIVVFVGYCPNL